MLIKLVEQKNDEIKRLKEVNEEHKELNGKLRAENDDLQKSVEYINEAYQDIGKKFFELDEKTCLHCGSHKPDYCEECYQKLIATNTELQHKLNHSNMQIENKDKIIYEMASFIQFCELDSKITEAYCPDDGKDCKYPDEHSYIKRILEYFEKRVKENEVQKTQTEEM